MIICGMLEIPGILSENCCQAVGSPHLLKAGPWDLSHLQLNCRREEMQPKDQAAHTGKHHIHYGWAAQCKIKRCSSVFKTLQMPLSLL